MNQLKKHLPNILSLLNCASAFLILICFCLGLYQRDAYYFQWGLYGIILAIFFDIMDGIAARKLNAGSELGKLLDSKCDAISFGITPALVFFISALAMQTKTLLLMWVGISSLVYLFAVLFRLARFDMLNQNSNNNDKTGHLFFQGLPSPAGALVAVAASTAALNGQLNIFLLSLIILFTAYLMISNHRYADMPKHYAHGKRKYYELIPFPFLVVILGLPWSILLYCLLYELSPLKDYFKLAKKEN